ncbi:MAG: hypothetical protein P4L87_08385 [Formivibrio sp.]|nr:hypothetical protein [Formivibrio sp.]
MTNSREHSQEELRRQILAETIIHAPENISATADIEHRHNAPIQTALSNEAPDYEWKRETGEVQSYQQTHAGSWLHIDTQGQFYDRQAQPVTREAALEQDGLSNHQQPVHDGQTQSRSGPDTIYDQGSKYPPAEPVALRLLAPQRGLFATVRSKSKNKSKSIVQLSSLPQHWQFEGEHTPGILKVLLPPRQSRGISLLD